MIPSHIGIIPDGNRRYGSKHGLSLPAAYGKGLEKTEEMLEWCRELGIKMVTIWGFSTENFRRSLPEKRIFFSILENKIEELVNTGKMEKNRTRVNIIGKKGLFPKRLSSLFTALEKNTSGCKDLQLNFAMGYGGRQEIVDACNSIIMSGRKDVDEEGFSSHLYTSGIPDPEIVIRTSGESRLSGFMPWQCVYSEIFFMKPLWPELQKSDFVSVIKDFESRDRRFGK